MRLKNQDEITMLYPLSHNPKLTTVELPGVEVYFSYLKEAFQNENIKNIAVTGDFGSGKSSIIHSFDHAYGKRRTPFLYISMGEYAAIENTRVGNHDDSLHKRDSAEGLGNCEEGASRQNGAERSEGEDPKMSEGSQCCCGARACVAAKEAEQKPMCVEENAVERRLLLQIYAKYRQKQLPSCEFRHIPEHPKWYVAILLAFYALICVLLMIKKPLAALLYDWDMSEKWIMDVKQWILNYHEGFEMALYAIVLIGFVIIAYFGFWWLIARFRTSKVILKSGDTEVDMEQQGCQDYLDRHIQDVVYCLEQIGRKINYTVVFEDMDRLPKDVYIRIFTRLREINHMINTRLPRKKRIRFVFAINESIANHVVNTKFFDYMLPIVPAMNTMSSESIFQHALNAINRDIRESMMDEWCVKKYGKVYSAPLRILGEIYSLILQMAHQNANVTWYAEQLERVEKDIRKNNNIRSHTRFDIEDHDLPWSDVVGRLVQRYKHFEKLNKCFVDVSDSSQKGLIHTVAPAIVDYRMQYAILNDYAVTVHLYEKNNPGILDSVAIEKILAFSVYKYVWAQDFHRLRNGEKCIFWGLDPETASHGCYANILEQLQSSNRLDVKSLYYAGYSKEAIMSRWGERLNTGTPDQQIRQIGEIGDNMDLARFATRYFNKTHQADVRVLAAMIQCLLRMQYISTTWFFVKRDIGRCLQALELLSDSDCAKFMDWCKGNQTNYDIFKRCANYPQMTMIAGGWTRRRATIFVKGISRKVCECPHVNVDVELIDEQKTLNLQEWWYDVHMSR